jgi:acetyltransferase-like isoleucine patch superfamily enzyme
MHYPKINAFLLRRIGFRIGENNFIWSTIKYNGTVSVEIGNNTFVGDSVTFTGGDSLIKIGNFCDIASMVSFVTGTHKIERNGPRIAGEGFSRNIVVGNRVWIGYNVIILGGVNIHDNVIVGAGSVVIHDLPSNGIYAGNPAKLIKSLL